MGWHSGDPAGEHPFHECRSEDYISSLCIASDHPAAYPSPTQSHTLDMHHSPYTRSSVTTPQMMSAAMEPTIAGATTAGEYSLDDPAPYHKSLYDTRPANGLASAANIQPQPKPIQRDMNFAQKNSTAAKPGFQTPLAQYTG
jgi:hypothetical protein